MESMSIISPSLLFELSSNMVMRVFITSKLKHEAQNGQIEAQQAQIEELSRKIELLIKK
jgi:hypothetical protein